MAPSSDADACVPKVITDFIFDLYDSVTLSHIHEEQVKFYNTDFYNLHHTYFSSGGSSNVTLWPQPQAIASECNGHPLFLALYRELTDRQWHATERPTLRDRMEGWQVYQQLFDEILEDPLSIYVIPQWCFDILHEFVYQFQGYCQVRSAVYASVNRINNAAAAAETGKEPPKGDQQKVKDLMENYRLFQQSDAWDVEAVFGYLKKFVSLGQEHKDNAFCLHLSLFSSVALSRLECLLGDYNACLKALTPVLQMADVPIPQKTNPEPTHLQVLHSVVAARLSMAYHAGIAFLMLRRYKDAMSVLSDISAVLLRGIKTGQFRKAPEHHHRHHDKDGQTGAVLHQQQQSSIILKQHDRMMNLLAILSQLLPGNNTGLLDDGVAKAMREKFGKAVVIDGVSNKFEDYFACPQFITIGSYPSSFSRQQVMLFGKEMKVQTSFQTLRSYLKLYTSLPLEKLAKFHDQSVEEFLPLLLCYKSRMRQLESTTIVSADGIDYYAGGSYKIALDIHYYVVMNVCFIDEAEKQRRFENYFYSQIAQATEIQKDAIAINTRV